MLEYNMLAVCMILAKRFFYYRFSPALPVKGIPITQVVQQELKVPHFLQQAEANFPSTQTGSLWWLNSVGLKLFKDSCGR